MSQVLQQDAMRWAALILSVILLAACSSPSVRDEEKLRALQQKFGDQYDFTFEACCYLSAVLKRGFQHSENQALEIAGSFLINGTAKRDTSYQYVNFFDSDGRFLYQLFYDPSSKRFERSKTPHY